jgi:hypothetical protein
MKYIFVLIAILGFVLLLYIALSLVEENKRNECSAYCNSKNFAYYKFENNKCYCGRIMTNGTIWWIE